MTLQGSTIRKIHPTRGKLGIRPRKQPRSRIAEAKVTSVQRPWFAPRKTTYQFTEQTNQHWFYLGAVNLMTAHSHRLHAIDRDDVATAFRSLFDVIGVPQKIFVKTDDGTVPAVKITFRNDRSEQIILVDEIREYALQVLLPSWK